MLTKEIESIWSTLFTFSSPMKSMGLNAIHLCRLDILKKEEQCFDHRPARIETVLMKLKHTALVSHISNLMGLLVLLSLVVFLIWASMLMRQATEEVKTSISVSDTYQHILS